MTTRLLVGDVFERMAELPDHSFDLIVTSPPFLALRSYLPDGHSDKTKEIGSDPTPAAFLDTMLAVTAEWRRLLAPHGSIAVELGDTYAGSGGAGGDYNPDGLREGQPKFRQNNLYTSGYSGHGHGYDTKKPATNIPLNAGPGWPLEKSLTGIPTLYAWSLAYGRNLLTGQPSPAGQWRIRNLKPWIRSNPPVGALGDKERPATSYITVACVGRTRWFDLDAVRTAPNPATNRRTAKGVEQIDRTGKSADRGGNWASLPEQAESGGAPPLDWWHPIDALIDDELNQRARDAGKPNRHPRSNEKRADAPDGQWATLSDHTGVLSGANGTHIRRRLEAAGYLQRGDFYDISPKGYAGAHYAVWPPELVRQLIDEMCPRRVCVICGAPSRRITETTNALGYAVVHKSQGRGMGRDAEDINTAAPDRAERVTLGWSDCGCSDAVSDPTPRIVKCPRCGTDRWAGVGPCGTCGAPGESPSSKWRPGRILDPFVGSGTTLAVASGMGRDSVGIDLDMRNAVLALDRVGPMLLEIDWPPPDFTLATLPRGGGDYRQWITDQQVSDLLEVVTGWLHSGQARKALTVPVRNGRRPVVDVPGQVGMFDEVPA